MMWAYVYIILHNLIICIEGDNFNEKQGESLVRTGLDYEHGASNTNKEDEPRDMLEQAQQ